MHERSKEKVRLEVRGERVVSECVSGGGRDAWFCRSPYGVVGHNDERLRFPVPQQPESAHRATVADVLLFVVDVVRDRRHAGRALPRHSAIVCARRDGGGKWSTKKP